MLDKIGKTHARLGKLQHGRYNDNKGWIKQLLRIIDHLISGPRSDTNTEMMCDARTELSSLYNSKEK